MKVSDFNYYLPEELIAQTPLKERDSSRLMVLNKENETITHKHFRNIIDYLDKDDILVLNNTRVLPARLIGSKKETGGKIEFLLLNRLDTYTWEVLAKPGKYAKKGREFIFGDGILECVVKEVKDDGNRIIEFKFEGIFEEILDKLGEMPLPPYIHEKLDDRERYQTVYSKEEGSAAAPTAGLHFTNDLLLKIKEKGIETAFVTLHVGLGTFRPVSVEDIDNHHMHSEFYMIDEENANKIEKARKNGKRIIAVGTTSVRTLESIMRDKGEITPCSGWTDIFIYPGYTFKAVNAIITNFHLPESTLIMLVSAFVGRDFIMRAYEEAVKERYRFFSFGDAMFIEKRGK